jgi:hypothetical protein
MQDVGRSASTDVPSGTSSLVGAPDEVFGTHSAQFMIAPDETGCGDHELVSQ